MLRVFESQGSYQADLHLADDPQVPLYDIQDSKELQKESMANMIESLEISQDHKLIFN